MSAAEALLHPWFNAIEDLGVDSPLREMPSLPTCTEVESSSARCISARTDVSSCDSSATMDGETSTRASSTCSLHCQIDIEARGAYRDRTEMIYKKKAY